MSEDFDPEFQDSNIQEEVERFEAMLRRNEERFYDADTLADIVDYYLSCGEITWAERALNLGLSQHPYSADLKIRMAQVLARKQKYREALRILTEAENLEGQSPEIHLFKAEIYSELQDFEKSVASFHAALELTPAHEQEFILIDLATEYQNQGKLVEARKCLERAIHQNPKSDLAYLEFLFICQMEEKVEEAEAFFQHIIDKDPYNPVAWYYLGLCYQDMELYEKSIEAFDFSITIDETYVEGYIQKSESLIALELYEMAIPNLLEAMKHTENRVRIHYTLGECYENLHQYEKALEYYKATVEIHPEIADGWFGMAICYGHLNKFKDALSLLSKSLELDPDNTEYRLAQAVYLSHTGNFGESEALFEELKEKYPENVDVWIDYGEMYYRLDDPAMAMQVTFEGLKYHPDNPELFYRISGYLFFLGNRKEGLKTLESALNLFYDGHTEFLNLFPDLSKDPEIVEAIQNCKPNEN